MARKSAMEVHDPRNILYDKYNTGLLDIQKKNKLGVLDTWINSDGILNILLIPNIEKYGYCITYDTQQEWTVHTKK